MKPSGGFRDLAPNAAGASARSKSVSAADRGGEGGGDGAAAAAAASDNGSVQARVLKGIAGGGRGAFGRSGDSTREDRILEVRAGCAARAPGVESQAGSKAEMLLLSDGYYLLGRISKFFRVFSLEEFWHYATFLSQASCLA